MKKVMLVAAMVFATSSLVNAESIIKNDPYSECNELYFGVYDLVKSYTGDEYLAIELAIKAEENCFEDYEV